MKVLILVLDFDAVSNFPLAFEKIISGDAHFSRRYLFFLYGDAQRARHTRGSLVSGVRYLRDIGWRASISTPT